MAFNEKYSILSTFKKDKENYIKFKENYEANFIKYKTEERFIIPVIGMISSGKSTFLNSLLKGNYLSSSTNVDTSFICILRHNKSLNQVPKLYKCKIKYEKINYKYNIINYHCFEKQEEIKGNILDNIKKINEEIKKYEKEVPIDKRDINKYFYLMELNIQLFESDNELGNYFDLVDIPGLNGKDDFYFKKIIPILVEKSLFSIYIFDIEHFQDENNLKIFKKYNSMRVFKNNSLYVLNKIDLINEEKENHRCKDEKYYIDIFLNLLTKKNQNKENIFDDNEEGFNVDLNKNIFLKLSSLELFNEINLYSNFKIYISYLIYKNKGKENDDLFNFTEAIKENLIKNFQINEHELENIINDERNEKYEEFFDKNEYKEIINIIANNCFQNNIEENDYKKFKFIFKTKKKKINSSIYNLKIINEKLIECMNKSIDEFFDWNKVLNLIDIFKKSIENIFGDSEEGIKYIELVYNLIKDIKNELNDKSALKYSNWDIKLIEQLKKIIDSLIKLDENNSSLIHMKENFDSLTYYVYNYRKIRISLLGGYSTGKSSFLNCLIGKDILPCDINRCTNRAIIIRHNENEKSQLFKTKFIKVKNPEYYYFEEEKEPLCEGDEEIKKKLIELNSEKADFENSFIILKIPLKMFSELDIRYPYLKKELMGKIELIDYPGLDIKDNLYQKEVFSPLMKFSDGFIFVNNCDLIEEKGNLNISEKIMNEIKFRKSSFSYKSCLFLMNKSDKLSSNFNIDESKKIFQKIYFKNNVNDNNDLNVDKFSSKLYSYYLVFYNKYIKEFKLYLKYIIDNLIKTEDKEKIQNYIDFLNLIKSITNNLKNNINKKLAKINYNIKENLNNINDCLYKAYKEFIIGDNINQIEKYIKNDCSLNIVKEILLNYLFLYNNYKFHNQRVQSNANSLFESLYKLFDNSYFYTEEQFLKYFNLFIEDFNNIFITIDLKIFGQMFKGQYKFKEKEKEYLDYEKKVNQISKETYMYIINEKDKILKNTKETLQTFYKNVCDNREMNNNVELENLEKNINDSIKNYIRRIKINLNELNLIKEKINLINVKMDDISIDGIVISENNSDVILNKNCRKYEEFISEDDNLIEKILKGIGNIFIYFFNRFNEKEILLENLKKYIKEINNLLAKYKEKFGQKVLKKSEKILNKIKDNLTNITGNFDAIIKKRKDYEKIKKEFYEVIYDKKKK